MINFTANVQSFFIKGPVGRLEALLQIPVQESGQAIAVICHPHPLFQGNLQNKVVSTLARVFDTLSIPSCRFNFRGVMQSEGSFADGVGECDDTLAVIAAMQEKFPHRHLVLAGFSFGGAMAIEAATRVATEKLILVAPSMRSLLTHHKPTCPCIIAQGEVDEVIDTASVYEFANTLNPPATLLRFPNVGHFFHGALTELKNRLVESL